MMRDLTLGELQNLREKIDPEYLRNCAVSFGVITAYFPALISMAGKYLKLSAVDRALNGYSVVFKNNSWGIVGPCDFYIQLESLDTCRLIVNRLNGLI